VVPPGGGIENCLRCFDVGKVREKKKHKGWERFIGGGILGLREKERF